MVVALLLSLSMSPLIGASMQALGGLCVLPSSLWAARAGINGRGERRGLTRSLAQGVFLKGSNEFGILRGEETPAQQPWLFLLPVGIAEQ